MSYYDRDYYMSGNKSNYGGKFLPYTDPYLYNQDLIEAKKLVSGWNPKNVLELGCATGRFTRALRSLGVEAWGIDISEWAIANADPSVKPFVKVGNITTDLRNYKDQEFDVVTAVDTLEHLEKAKVPEVIAEMCRIAKTYILIEVPITDNGVDRSHTTIMPVNWWSMRFTQHKFRLLSSGIGRAPDGITNFKASFTRKV